MPESATFLRIQEVRSLRPIPTVSYTHLTLPTIAERGGVTGINFCPSFLREEEPAAKKASTMDMVRHMKYLRNVGGIDIIGLGTDFDGFSGETDVPDTAHMQHLADVMSHDGFTDEEIEKVFSKNVLRVFRECWK